MTVTRNLFSAIMSTTIFSLICALIFLILDGVDVSLTEAAVGAGISTILFLSTLKHTDVKIKKSNKAISPLIGLFLLLLLSLSYIVSDLPEYGKVKVSSESYVTKYYIANSKTEMGITNVVTSVPVLYFNGDLHKIRRKIVTKISEHAGRSQFHSGRPSAMFFTLVKESLRNPTNSQ